mgnify:CR=1 FL=1
MLKMMEALHVHPALKTLFPHRKEVLFALNARGISIQMLDHLFAVLSLMWLAKRQL